MTRPRSEMSSAPPGDDGSGAGRGAAGRAVHVVVVESPAKAKTIGRYLGDGYRVLASYGHAIDLPARDGSVRPGSDFEMVYETAPRARRALGAIRAALAGAESLVLATDPDREGEAISWQVLAWLRERGAIGDAAVRRVVFHEITPEAVREAMARPRELDMDLVHAQQARRALDYLVGFHLSPVLWRKIPGSRSAGRVQSVALRLVCEREAEIESFVPREYWTVDADLATRSGAPFAARLERLDGAEPGGLGIETHTIAERARERVRSAALHVEAVERDEARRVPPPPFTTASLQQDASRRLGFPVRRTMELAQALYEGVELAGDAAGLITYMRTDSTALSRGAAEQAMRIVERRYGEPYLPAAPPAPRAPAPAAREAHEAIRPTDFSREPEWVADRLGTRRRAALRAHLATGGRQPDGPGAHPAGARRHRLGTGRPGPARERRGAGIRRLSPALPRGPRRRPRARGGRAAPARDDRGRDGNGRRGARHPAIHPSSAALHRGRARAQARGARDRTPLHLRVHRGGAARARIRRAQRTPLRAARARAGGHRVPRIVLRPLAGLRLHRRPRTGTSTASRPARSHGRGFCARSGASSTGRSRTPARCAATTSARRSTPRSKGWRSAAARPPARGPAPDAGTDSSRSGSGGAAPSSDARTSLAAASPARSPPASEAPGRTGPSATTRTPGCRSRCGVAATGPTSRGASPAATTRPRASPYRRDLPSTKSPWPSRAPCLRSPARSASTPRRGRRSWPGWGATVPGSNTNEPMSRSRPTTMC